MVEVVAKPSWFAVKLITHHKRHLSYNYNTCIIMKSVVMSLKTMLHFGSSISVEGAAQDPFHYIQKNMCVLKAPG